MFDRSYIKATGQLWKLALFLLVMPVTGLALITLAMSSLLDGHADVSVWLIILGILFSMGGYVVGGLTVRCPQCGARLLWRAVRESSHREWLSRLMTLERCPFCLHNHQKLEP
jgi:uncharacterized membrane protein